MDVNPPTRNATVVYANESGGSAVNNKRTANPSKKKKRKVYSAFRKVIAPYLVVLNKIGIIIYI